MLADCISQHIPKTKNFQGGSYSPNKNIYANPFFPDICFFVQFGIALLSKNRTANDLSSYLYDGVTEANNFSNYLKDVFSKLTPGEMYEIGRTKNIGPYSLKKGCMTYGASIGEYGSVLAILIRGEYKFPGIFSSYFMAGCGADEITGKKVATLYFLNFCC